MTPQIDCLGKMTQNMHSQPPVASQHKKTNKVVWTYEDDRPPKRTSTYERPFTQEGNYLVISSYIFKTNDNLAMFTIPLFEMNTIWGSRIIRVLEKEN